MDRRLSLKPLPALFALLLLVPCAAAADDDDAAGWARRLLAQPTDVLLRVRLDDGFGREGYRGAVTADSLVLAHEPGGTRLGACALAAIVAVERRGGGAGRGWAVGRNVGAIGGAVVGLLFAALVDAVGEGEDEPTAASYAAATVGLATVGAVGIGGIGALINSGADEWYPLPPAEPRRRQRLALGGGLARGDGAGGVGYDGLTLRTWLPRRVAGAIDLGPEATWSNLGGTTSHWDGTTAEVKDTWSLGLAARFAPAGPGLAPFASAGLGWYAREDSWLGVNLGLGLRWQKPSGDGFDLELRWHSRSSGLDAEPGNGIMTVTAGWTFAL